MKTVVICTADPIGEEPVEKLRIDASVPIGDHIAVRFGDTPSIENSVTVFDEDAAAIEEALIRSLPGGTYDRLLKRMLERKASHFVVAHGD